MGWLRRAALVTLLWASATSAQAPQRIMTKVGSIQMLGAYSYVPVKCQAQGRTRVEILRAPRLGTLTVREDVQFTIVQSNYPQCIGVPSIGAGLFYEAKQPGQDVMRAQIIYPDNHRASVDLVTLAN